MTLYILEKTAEIELMMKHAFYNLNGLRCLGTPQRPWVGDVYVSYWQRASTMATVHWVQQTDAIKP